MRLKSSCPLVQLIGIVAAVCVIGGPLHATVAKAPPLSPSSIVGTWEAIETESLQLFVLKIGGLEPSKVGLVEVSGPGIPVVISFLATSVELDKSGRLVMVARAEQRGVKYVAEIRATGTGEGKNGIMRGTISVRIGPGNGTGGDSPIVFTKSEEGFARWLGRSRSMADAALAEKGTNTQ